MPASSELSIILKLKDEASKELKNVTSKLEDMQPAFKRMAVVGTAATAALGIAIKGLVKEGLESAQISESFERMTKSMGYSGDELLRKLSEVSAGTVDMTSLMLTSNRAMSLGVGRDIDTMATLMEIARVKGRALGLDTTQAFNDIVTGIGRGSPLILDNLGIVVKLGEAQEQYAEYLGKTAAELTEAEKKEALLNAVLVSGREELEAMGDVALTASERMAQVKAQFSNIQSTLGEALLPALEAVIDAINPLIGSVSTWISENPRLAATILGVVTGLTALVTIVGTFGLLLPGIITMFSHLAITINATIWPITLVVAAIAALIAVGVLLYRNWDTIKEKTIEVWNSIASFFSGIWEAIKNTFVEYLKLIVGSVAVMLDSLVPNWEEKLLALRDFTIEIFNGIGDFFNAFIKNFMEAWEVLSSFFSGLWKGIVSTFQSAVEKIAEFLDPIMRKIERAIQLISDIGGNIGSAVSSAVSTIKERGAEVLGIEDAVITPSGKVIRTDPADWLMATKNPAAMAGSGGITINVYGDVTGQDLIKRVGEELMRNVKREFRL
jgi:phage-related protein